MADLASPDFERELTPTTGSCVDSGPGRDLLDDLFACSACRGHAMNVQLEVMFKSSAADVVDRRALDAERGVAVGAALLRAAGADQRGAHRRQSAPVHAGDPA